ncbi:putative quinol monooxygenase [Streptomyces sp. V3I7]|uniref:putative quinol monooxygenase n=1 Tax=Streptomyces sp. V3I7 TaxID=3042278 RepID=UPI00278A6A44|nr:putative quinol monooxygenase [Streptomyces sp. V3I7]MDQ0989431.1 quinol monooxygenase YgiN [Streptomyces sp. V3I7]
MTYGLVTKFLARPGGRDALADCLLQAAKLMERDSGCIHYVVSTSDEPEAVWVSEVWTDRAAHDASLEPEDIRAVFVQARPLIASVSEQTPLAVLGGVGLPS